MARHLQRWHVLRRAGFVGVSSPSNQVHVSYGLHVFTNVTSNFMFPNEIRGYFDFFPFFCSFDLKSCHKYSVAGGLRLMRIHELTFW